MDTKIVISILSTISTIILGIGEVIKQINLYNTSKPVSVKKENNIDNQ